MFHRLINPSRNNSFFLFGARGTGKSTFIEKQFKMKKPWTINLLDSQVEDYYARSPKRIELEWLQLKKKPDWIVIDEIQRVPRLLDWVHLFIERHGVRFILTGSSARKLKRGASNLLAGRAFLNELFPLTPGEMGEKFQLRDYLHWGGLPKIYSLASSRDRADYLSSYVLTYLQEEIRMEQVVRKLDPFRNFLEIAGQMSGKIINHKKISDQVGVELKTVQSYFQILEETLLGFYLPAFSGSVRKSQRISPKFYIFDTGVKKALEGSLDQIPSERTSVYGDLFEAMVILNFFRLNKYLKRGFRLSYFSTKNQSEVDLVLTKGQENRIVEIKSTETVDEQEVRSLNRLAKAFPGRNEVFYLSRDQHPQKMESVQCLPWDLGLKEALRV